MDIANRCCHHRRTICIPVTRDGEGGGLVWANHAGLFRDIGGLGSDAFD